MGNARDAALKAVAGDAGEASAQLALARIAGEYEHDWNGGAAPLPPLASERILPAVRALCAQYILWPLGRLDELTEAIRPAASSPAGSSRRTAPSG